MNKPKGVSLFKLNDNRINQILEIWDRNYTCTKNCQVVSDCDGSCKNK